MGRSHREELTEEWRLCCVLGCKHPSWVPTGWFKQLGESYDVFYDVTYEAEGPHRVASDAASRNMLRYSV